MQAIQSAQIHYNDQGTPVSDLFGDVYFSNESGLEETQYVFLRQNGLPERWLQHPAEFFHIIETGFGTGLNFLLAWHNFRQALAASPAMRCQRLYFSSFEKYPITHADLTLALTQWPTLAPLAAELLAQYPSALPGCHRLQLNDGKVILDLWLGDVHDSMPQLSLRNQADAWFLDGFAPSKNPQMWQPELFSQMARLSKPGCTVATFTSAGLVRRGLSEVGFQVKKIKGYGRKREMSVGTFAAPASAAAAVPATGTAADIFIAGGGLASICLALALVNRGQKVHLICKDKEIANGASHNRQGALYPQLQSTFSAVSALHAHAFGFARRFYQRLHKQNFEFPHDFCGVLTLACTDQLALRQQKISQQPVFTETLLQPLTQQQASEVAGVTLPFPGLFFPQGGWIAPQLFCQSALTYLLQQAGFTVSFDCELHDAAFEQSSGLWQLKTSQGLHQSKQLCLATGAALATLPMASKLPVNLVRGQVSHLHSEGMAGLQTVICHQGYITPAAVAFSGQAEHCVGATFDRSRQQAIELEEDNAANLALVNKVLQQPAWFNDAEVISAKAGVRATIPDHLPLAGSLANKAVVFGGLGARGLLFAPILAEQLAAELCGEPTPLPVELAALVSPRRFEQS
ncbi:bifunctional tRNA (5-methylaminomethyl-2-thiouridine)(34)-methyltransferase MnmD/FAD-dependent 5-carboxymethylaminomethyl-2-thiouridine(34) oxidoreductase MnmC [Rheinheimera riviphila]|uniref:tRNA 5-methylaminomethyl-2-thiouridine biosynthesis bifunctional protein MnmC n=1 Tax=Rheinheimera riviphila TaxID=1834037 RepID=A0A437R1A2_9GAMM|nr:bifunctional tRNA (5-methylaminomethyl-2-thiouridine)(34)-methyltransferase MnmD/FAD-dependent 5-carboxymethylaminomethyl-2-thiouridine(34) oxidoreductase MnmC [Rheinheimera riviphila]RVU40532.1 bifunctional tRNA (5-methylaminomethyl-2-thiouridine)(34)-methyltransferase MnmD/FAD-dependent 5-carboxymethylaminomethyl-2-thiouridine(34) oxidoreductase MnmC [Rheinheimera riviphila]